MRSRILIASLAANIVLAGAVLYVVSSGGNHPDVPSPARHAAEDRSPAKGSVATPALAIVPASLDIPPEFPVAQVRPPANVPSRLASSPLPPQQSWQPPAPAPAAALLAPVRTPRAVATSDSPSSAPPDSFREGMAAAASDADPAPGTGLQVNSAARGNFFVSRGIRAAVAETFPASAKGGAAPLGMDFSPVENEDGSAEPASADVAPAGSPAPSADTAGAASSGGDSSAKRAASSPGGDQSPGTPHRGLTEEEELFRMKWGWAAYDAAQAEAMREAGRRNKE